MTTDKYIKNYINGALVAPASAKYLENLNPSNGKAYGFLPDSDAGDIQSAVEAAERAFPVWSTCGLRKRFRILMRIADIIEQNLEIFAKAESLDTGKPVGMIRSVVIPRGHTNFRYYATSILHFHAENHHLEGEAYNTSLYQPLGVVACISPSYLPLYFFSWKIAPALAAGNCVVAKPSELTPTTAYLLAQACIEAGLPPGVLNIVHGSGSLTGQILVEHPKIKAVSFTGSTQVGSQIARTAAPHFKKTLLQLSSKNVSIIFDDSDFNQMMVSTLRSSFSSSGQNCFCLPRIYIERPLYERFREEFVKRSLYLKVGDPFSSITDMGAITSKEHFQRARGYLSLAQVEGATILAGAEPMSIKGEFQEGFFMRPTILEGVPHESRVNQEEICGPVVNIFPFDTEEEVVHLSNNTDFGMAASIWTKDISKAYRVAEQLQSSLIWINSWMIWDMRVPYSGRKHSGLGNEGGMEALKFFTHSKNMFLKY